MLASDFRKMAREKLDGKWGTAVCMILAYGLVFFVIGLIQGLLPETGLLASIVSIGESIIEIPLAFGLTFAFFNLFYNENVKAFSFWNLGFDNFGRSWGIAFRTALKLIGPVVLMIVSILLIAFSASMSTASAILGSSSSTFSDFILIIEFILFIASIIWAITKSYYYILAEYVAFDNPNLTPKECVEKSQELMTNRRGKLFGLEVSFIGWAILVPFTLYIGMLWLLPYIQMATIAFYHVVSNKDNNVDVEITEN